jgi:GGDEF domain-containing protein/transcriptional regulator with XRE-family HTH domain
MMDFPRFLRSYLSSRKLSQKQLAERLQVSHVSLSKWLNGRMTPRPTTIAKIVAALGEDASGHPGEIHDRPMSAEGARDTDDDLSAEIFRASRDLSTPGRRFVLKMIEELKRSYATPGAGFAGVAEEVPHHLLLDMPGVVFRAIAPQDGTVACIYVSPQSRDILGHDPSTLLEARDLPYRAIVAAEDRAWVTRATEEFLVADRTGHEWHAKFRILTTDGLLSWVELRTRMTIRDSGVRQIDGLILRAVADTEDEVFGELRSRDPRTDLYGRPYFLRLLAVALDDIVERQGVGVILLQISDFPAIAAAHGVAWGDALQRATAKRLTALVRRTDVVGYIEDGVFGVLITGLPQPSALTQIAAKLAAGLGGAHQLSGQAVPVLVHAAFLVVTQSGHDAIDLLRCALDAVRAVEFAPEGAIGRYDAEMAFASTGCGPS